MSWLSDQLTAAEPTDSLYTLAEPGRIPLGRAALAFVANGAPKGSQRNEAVKAARNYLGAGYDIEATADALWLGLQRSPNDPARPWTWQDAYNIARDIAESPAPPIKPLQSGELIVDVPRAASIGTIHSDAPNNGVVSERKQLRFRTAAEVAQETTAEVQWVAKPWFAKHAITDVTAKIKVGKTTWVMDAVRCVLDGIDFLGQPTTSCPVVYLTEQLPTTFREALRRAALLERHDFHTLSWVDTIGLTWPEVMVAVLAKCRGVGAGLLIVDTLGKFAGLKGDAENQAGAAMEAMQPLQEAAATGLAIVTIRHDRKSGGEVGESARGSSAYGGEVDLMIQVKRTEGNGRASARVITTVGRFDETPENLVIDLTQDGYVSMGSTTAVGAAITRSILLSMAPADEGAACSEKDLLAFVESKTASRTTVRMVRDALMAEGLMRRNGTGVKGNPYLYWRTNIRSDSTQNTNSQNELHRGLPVLSPKRFGVTAAESPALAAYADVQPKGVVR